MPINSYISPHLLPSPTATTAPTNSSSAPTSADQHNSAEVIQPPQPTIQRLGSHSSQNSSSQQQQPDRRRRGSSLGNLFSTLTSSLRQQAPSTNQGANQLPSNSSSASLSSNNNNNNNNNNNMHGLSHQLSTATIRPSLVDSRYGSSNNQATASHYLSLLMSPTVADIHGLHQENSNRSSSSINRESLNGQEIHEMDEMMIDPVDELEEETEEQARTRQNSTAVTPALAESANDKRENDGSYSIRLTPFIDHSSSSPALYFSPLIRRLKPGMRLPVGRYTERNREAAQAPHGSSAAVVFKSKVVSRTHLEILVDDHGNWYIKDLKSSSGTFLNHIRLSPAGVESDDCMICDGDILQLGMDFRGGSEEIFRCVKVRIELNKSWKRKTHNFNKEAHKKLLGEEIECCICLNNLKVGDSIFISPCSHSWHYKCIRPLLVRNYPQFHCPNCRSITDLEEDDDDDDDD